jgi:hypothetical protein
MIRRLAVALALTLACATCKRETPKPSAPVAGPTVRATVITLRTTIEPGKRSLLHTIVVAGDRARSTAEHDTWRLFDTKAKTVTIVDEIDRTIRTETLDSIEKKREAAMKGGLPAGYPAVTIQITDERRPILGVTARKSVIESGAYRRELWLGEHAAIPERLFAMMQSAEVPSSPLAPMLRRVDEVLREVKGFPLVDHSEVPYGDKKLVVDRSVLSVTQHDVPQTMLAIPAQYRDVTPKTK